MADDEVLESESEVREETGSPTSPPSIPSIDEQTSAQGPSVEDIASATAEKLRPMIKEEVARTFQSGKDVRFDSVEKIHKYLQDAGGDVAKATRDMKLDEIYERLDSNAAAGTAAQGSDNEKYAQAQTQLALDDAGIPYDDPAYVSLVAQYGTLPAEQWIDVARTWAGQQKDKRAKQENIPGAAAAASESGKVITAEGDEDIESLTQELTKLMAQPATAETMKARAELRQRLSAQQDKIGLLQNVRFDGS